MARALNVCVKGCMHPGALRMSAGCFPGWVRALGPNGDGGDMVGYHLVWGLWDECVSPHTPSCPVSMWPCQNRGSYAGRAQAGLVGQGGHGSDQSWGGLQHPSAHTSAYSCTLWLRDDHLPINCGGLWVALWEHREGGVSWSRGDASLR